MARSSGRWTESYQRLNSSSSGGAVKSILTMHQQGPLASGTGATSGERISAWSNGPWALMLVLPSLRVLVPSHSHLGKRDWGDKLPMLEQGLHPHRPC